MDTQYSVQIWGECNRVGVKSVLFGGCPGSSGLYQVFEDGQLIATYTYNALGQRSIKVTPQGTIYYLYGPGGELIGEYDESGQVVREYVYLNGEPLAVLESGDSITYLHTDHLNTPRRATDESGELVWSWDSDAFGNAPANSDPDSDGQQMEINFRFPGQYYDQESGLHYNYFRDYDPSLGRYLTADPIGILKDYSDPQLQVAIEMGLVTPQGWDGSLNHLYGYVDQNPVNFIDPTGLDSLRAALMQAIARGNTRQIRNIMDALSDPKLKKAAQDALDKFGSKADDWIGKNCKGSINREFPDNLRDKTLEEIRRGNSAEYKKAWKLLNDKRFQK